MKLVFEEVTIRNFLSFGNVAQTINLQDKNYQIIIGQNKDKSDSEDDRNGVGKSTIFEAIHYALFGKSIGNKISLGTLVNNINKKNMYVTIKFKKDDNEYVITRGRLPNVLVLSINGEDYTQDESQGDSRDTQSYIENILGISEDIFDQIICLSCKVQMYYNQTTSNQKAILEKILGIDIISKKIEALKNLIKETKNEFNNEQFKINTLKTQNENLLVSINKQVEAMNVAKNTRLINIQNNISNCKDLISKLEHIDFDKEMENFKLLENYITQEGVNKQNQQLKESLEKSIKNEEVALANFNKIVDVLGKIDFNEESVKHAYNNKLKEEESKFSVEKMKIEQQKKSLDSDFIRVAKAIDEKKKELDNLKEAICPTCGQKIGVEEVEKIRNIKSSELKVLEEEYHKIDMEIIDVVHNLEQFKNKTFEYVTTLYPNVTEQSLAIAELQNARNSIGTTQQKLYELKEQLSQVPYVELGDKPVCLYQSMEVLLGNKSALEQAQANLKIYEEQLKENPFQQQEESIEEMKKNIVEIDESALRDLDEKINNQNILLKLLNSPSSFIRKAILEKSLEFLNAKIKEYLIKLGSTDIVSFNSDMSMTITRLGLEYGYVSTGEEGRISFALMMAFRDVWESLNNCSINLLTFDEIIDRIGLDTAGVACAVKAIKEKSDKNVFIVSHNDTLIAQTPDVIKLVKRHGFTNIGETEE